MFVKNVGGIVKMEAKIKVEYSGENKMFLHKELGKGNLPNGIECRLLQSNAGIHMQVYDKEKKNWKTYSVSYMDLSKGISEVIPLEEKK